MEIELTAQQVNETLNCIDDSIKRNIKEIEHSEDEMVKLHFEARNKTLIRLYTSIKDQVEE